MPTDLFFLNTMPQNPSTAIQRSKIGSSAKAQFPDTYAADKSWGSNHKSFAATLRKVSQDQQTTACSREGYRRKSIAREAFEPAEKPDKNTDSIAGQDDGTSEMISHGHNCESREMHQRPFRREFSAFMDLLETMGLLDSAGGKGFRTEDMAGDSGDGAATLKILSERLTQINSLQSSDMTTELESLRQLIAKAIGAKISSQSIENPVGRLPLSQESKLAEFAQLLEGMHTAQSTSGEKPSETIAAINRIVAETGNHTGEAGVSKSAENSEIAFQSENQEKAGKGKLATATRADGTETSENAKEAAALRLASADSSKLEEDTDMAGKTRVSDRADRQNPNSTALGHGTRYGNEPVQQNRPIEESPQVSKMIDDAQVAKDSDRGERPGGETGQENLQDHESSAVSKMIKDAQAVKDNPMKMGAVISDDPGGKMNTSDGGTNYNGQFNSEGQNAEKAFESISSSKETETGQSALKTQTLNQIVQKAVIHLQNGQHEARIDLKPDYLGHVRMQVITENQQVTVKILAEFSFVKDLIENNAHQLKADLQQQGLNVDKLEVSVSRDPDEHKHSPENGERLNPRRHSDGHDDADYSKEDVRMQTGNVRNTAVGASAVDYFA